LLSPVVTPREPESLAETGLAEATVEQNILRILYFRGELYGKDLSTAIGLRFSVIQEIVEALKLSHHLQVKRSMGMGNVGSVFALTESGRELARQYLESNQYSGPAPVPAEQYADIVRRQRQRDGWLTKEALARAFRGMVLTESILKHIGPAVSAGNSLLLYGKPGDGKTYLVESLANLDTAPIFVPYAIECQGNIVQVFDPIYHHLVDEAPAESTEGVSIFHDESPYDRRWAKCKRPFIVSGGELSLEMLDLRYNQTSKVYEAPFQLKANNGIYLIDDFGRQRATPAEVLNRWIVPMERRQDYLSFLTGGKMSVPFEIFLVFSTNLNPADLGDEAFLRRIQYKMLLRGPSEKEFIRIFEDCIAKRRVACPPELIERFLDKHYRSTGKVFRRCHPRDLLSHALNLIHFEKRPNELTDEMLDTAFYGCFLEENANEEIPDAPILAMEPAASGCPDYWAEKIGEPETSFGVLALLGKLRDAENGRYHEEDSVRQFGAEETTRVLEELHRRHFEEWRSLGRERQTRDVGKYLETSPLTPAGFKSQLEEWVGVLVPAGSGDEDRCMFSHDLAMVAERLAPTPIVEAAPSVEPVPIAVPAENFDLAARLHRLADNQLRYSRPTEGTESTAAAS
jgi:hypothetical protein